MGTPCHFALFDLKPEFQLDLDQLGTRYRELARNVHPDRLRMPQSVSSVWRWSVRPVSTRLIKP